MDKINEEIDEMYKELTSSNEKSDDVNLKSLNDIRDLFRQHINKRRNEDQTGLVMDHQLIENIKDIKGVSFDILQKFKDLNTAVNTRNDGVESFTNLEEFNRFITGQQEILSSELWKLDVLLSFLVEK